MVYMPAAHTAAADPLLQGRLARVVDVITTWLDILGSAMRVARSIEVRREPAAADLDRLGIRGPVVKYY